MAYYKACDGSTLRRRLADPPSRCPRGSPGRAQSCAAPSLVISSAVPSAPLRKGAALRPSAPGSMDRGARSSLAEFAILSRAPRFRVAQTALSNLLAMRGPVESFGEAAAAKTQGPGSDEPVCGRPQRRDVGVTRRALQPGRTEPWRLGEIGRYSRSSTCDRRHPRSPTPVHLVT